MHSPAPVRTPLLVSLAAAVVLGGILTVGVLMGAAGALPAIGAPPSEADGGLVVVADPEAPSAPGPASEAHRPDIGGALTDADGLLPEGTDIDDVEHAGIAHLDPALRDALRRAADAAGIRFTVTSGWRSPAYQEALLQDAVARYGSREEAARWVATPQTSLHVSGDAVDIGGADALAWLSAHGADFGLCQVYANEPWHLELRAVSGVCPRMYADPTDDPRLQP